MHLTAKSIWRTSSLGHAREVPEPGDLINIIAFGSTLLLSLSRTRATMASILNLRNAQPADASGDNGDSTKKQIVAGLTSTRTNVPGNRTEDSKWSYTKEIPTGRLASFPVLVCQIPRF